MSLRLFVLALVLGGCRSAVPLGAPEASAPETGALDYTVAVETVRSGYEPDTAWTQAFVAAVPRPGAPPELVVTMSKLITSGIDNYGDLYESRSGDQARTWTPPHRVPALRRTTVGPGQDVVLGDFVPQWHAATGTLVGTGKLFVYDTESPDRDQEAGRAVGYSVYDAARGAWGPVRRLALPARDHGGRPLVHPTAGVVQRLDLPDGDVLLPINYVHAPEATGDAERNVTTVLRCRFDGDSLRYVEHGTELEYPSGRGVYEPSITAYDGFYYLTLRTDDTALVARSHDGLRYEPPVEWRFDDGAVLGSYNTQQHWVAHSDGLFLVYTRRGANNDHILRNRAPLFIGRVDPASMRVVRATERVLVPERGARLGNFGVATVDAQTTVVSVAERMQEGSVERGADNSVFVVRVTWSRPNRLAGR